MAKRKKSHLGPPETGKPAQRTAEQGQDATEAGTDSRPGFSLLRTCAVFAGVLLFLNGFAWLFSLKGHVQWGKGTASLVSAILNGMGYANSVDYNIIHLRNNTWKVTSECTAVNVVFLYVSFIVAYGSSLKAKAVGVAAGIPLILATNILRLVVLGVATEYWPDQAQLLHDYVWETLFIFFVIILWHGWINLVVNRD